MSARNKLQSTTPSQQQKQQGYLPPATPLYVLRGHTAPIHALGFFGQNSKLASGDADGWVVIWSVVTKRPVAVWKAHEGAVLEVKGFSFDDTAEVQIFTHGRDHKLRVWRFRAQDEEILDKTLPVDLKNQGSQSETKAQPWLLHSLSVNALNFCAFSLCFLPRKEDKDEIDTSEDGEKKPASTSSPPADLADKDKDRAPAPRAPLLLAVPNALNSGGIDIFHLPSERRVCTIPADPETQTGMVMAVNLFISPSNSSSNNNYNSGDIYLASGYEDGHVMVHVRRGPILPEDTEINSTKQKSPIWKWEKLYESRPHTQPILSLDVPPTLEKEYFLTSSADALLAKHPLPGLTPNTSAYLSDSSSNSKSGKSAVKLEELPLKVINTRHAGQQGLRIRSDGKIFATAGWDCRVRVYACRNMREMAVLKWHKEGCYAVAFADMGVGRDRSVETRPRPTPTEQEGTEVSPQQDGDSNKGGNERGLTAQTRPIGSLAAIQQQRLQRAQMTHWLAAGAKDGKISLWDIY
ncbi:hypothetical protein VTN00DRAFT_9921 [Thermoascus crustaceus]|uniref:uncharacterized protein n=1 Tax=Thermoascus crustaceus TaxID=5088 RepID=UPI003742916E